LPTYDFENTKTGEVFEDIMKYSEKVDFLKKNPHIIALVSPIKIGDPVRLGVKRVDNGFKDMLHKVKAAHPKGNINI
jgi:hypothetical protein